MIQVGTYLQSEKIDLLMQAMVKAQSEFPTIPKNGYNPHYKSHFSTYNDLRTATLPSLNKNGLSISHWPISEGDYVGIRTTVGHQSGQFISSAQLIKPTKPGPQDTGGIDTYFKRYGWAAACGVEGEIDDDGNAASTGKTAQAHTPHNTPSEPHIPPVTGKLQSKIVDAPAQAPAQWQPKYPRPTGVKAKESINEGAQKFWWILIKQTGWDKVEAQDLMEHMFGYRDPAQFNKADLWDFEFLLRTKNKDQILRELRELKGGDEPPPFTDADVPF